MGLTVENFKIGDATISVADKQCRENIISILQTINEIETKINSLPAINEEIQNNINALKSDVSALQNQTISLSNNINNVENSISNLETSKADKSAVSALQNQTNSLSNNINNVENSISNLETSKADNSDFNTQYTNITGELIDGSVCNRKGNIYLELGGNTLKSILNANTWTTLLTLPSGYRPISQILRTIIFAGQFPVILDIQTSGVVNGYTITALSSGTVCYDGVEFI